MNLRNSVLSGLLIGGGIWFIWAVFLIAKTVYANWFFMDLGPDLETGFFTYSYWYILTVGLGLLLILGAIGGILYYGFGHILFHFGEDKRLRRVEKEHRSVIKAAVGGHPLEKRARKEILKKVSKKKVIKRHTKKK